MVFGGPDPISATSGAVQLRRSLIDTPGAFCRAGLAVDGHVIESVPRLCAAASRHAIPGPEVANVRYHEAAKTLEAYLTSPPPPLDRAQIARDRADRSRSLEIARDRSRSLGIAAGSLGIAPDRRRDPGGAGP